MIHMSIVLARCVSAYCPTQQFFCFRKVSYAARLGKFVFLCLTGSSTRARKRRLMSEEEEEVQDQKQTIDAKCKARTQRALP